MALLPLAPLLLACGPVADSAQVGTSAPPPGLAPMTVSVRLEAAELGLDTATKVGFGGPGVAVADLDGDGGLDLAWVSPRGWGLTLWNDGVGGFTPELGTLPGGSGVSAGDLDDDGDVDLVVVGSGVDQLLWNDGAGRFVATDLETVDRESSSASLDDVDGDGDLDVFVATYLSALNGEDVLTSGGAGDGNRIFLNDHGTFQEWSGALDEAAASGLTFHGAFLDVDLDADRDLFLVNDFGPTVQPTQLLRNDGGTYTNVSSSCGCSRAMFAMGAGIGDPDGDGLPDLFVTNLGPPVFLRNAGDGRFIDAGAATGLQVTDDALHDTSWGASFVDVDLDGWEELAVAYGPLDAPGTFMADWLAANGGVTWENAPEQPDVLMAGVQGEAWRDVAAEVGFDERGVSKGVATGDLDGDGQPELVTVGLDFLVVHDPGPTPHHGLVVTLQGPPGNRGGLGARVEVLAEGRWRTRWMQPTAQGSFCASAPQVIVGLGPAEVADTVRVTWPGGDVTEWHDVPAGPVALTWP